MKLKDLIESNNTGLDAIKRAPIVDYDTGVRCIRIGDISNNRPFCDWGYTKVEANNYNKFQLKKGDIIVARTGATIGVNKYIDKDYKSVYNNGLIRIRVKEENNPKYIYYLLQSNNYKNFIKTISMGTSTQPNMQMNDLLNLDVPNFDRTKQDKIVELLGRIDQKIELNNEINNNLSEQIKSIYNEIFTEFIDYKRLDEISNVTIGKTPPRSEQVCFTTDKNDVKWISISDLGKSGMFIFDTSEKLTQEAVDKYNVKVIPKDTVILSFKLTVGRTGFTTEDMTTNEAIAHFDLNNKKLNNYLYCTLTYYNYSDLGSTSSIATAINSKIVKSVKIGIPSDEQLNKFNNLTSAMFKTIKNNESENIKLSELRDTLLPKLMNGEIDLDKIEL